MDKLFTFAFGAIAGIAAAARMKKQPATVVGAARQLLRHPSQRRTSSFEASAKDPLAAELKKSQEDRHHLNLKAMTALQAKTTVTPALKTRLFTVCLTGGPCSGKSSSLASFTKALTEKGFDVYAVPEIPTMIMHTGFPYPGMDGGELLWEFERQMFKTQLQLEETTIELALDRDRLERKRPCVVFYDRGLLDMKAYMTAEMWERLLKEFSLTEDDVLARYDLVIHLVTAADGALDFYTTANNDTRKETPEQAIANDTRVQVAWDNHPRRAVVTNDFPSFNGKVAAATDHVLDLINAAK